MQANDNSNLVVPLATPKADTVPVVQDMGEPFSSTSALVYIFRSK